MMKVAGIPEYAEWVPIEALEHLREYDRRPGGAEGADPEYWGQLKQHIAQHGFEDPITLEYNPDTGGGYIGEGNHRLQIAQELGQTHVPTMVYRTTKDDERMKPMHEPGTYRMEDSHGFSKFPQYAKPSLIGLPVKDEPFEPANERGRGPNNWYDWYKSQRTSMAADPYWLDHWVERNGPYLYHKVQNPDQDIPQILQQGLQPWDTRSGFQPNHHPRKLWPRPGHVYLRTSEVPAGGSPYEVRVDLRKLNSENLNPDEDAMALNAPGGKPGLSIGDEIGTEWTRGTGIPAPVTDEEYVLEQGGQSRGNWAEHYNISNPSETAYSLEDLGTLAHRGPIPPEAIDYPFGPKRANILDPIATELPPAVWDHPATPEPTLKPIHAHWITTHIYEILERGGYTKPHEWLKLYMTGSLCTYQYSDSSDVDVSLFVDAVSLPEWSRAEMIGLMIKGVEGLTLPGTPYELQAYVVSRNLTPSDLYRPGLRAGYDIATHRWVSPPDRGLAHDAKAQENGSYVYALEVADKMHKLLEYEPSKAVLLWHQIHRKRMADEKMGKGDFAESNLAYKMLFKRGLVPQIAEISGEHIAMAADPKWWGQMPALWHGTSLDRLPSIMTQGLLPWDHPQNEGSRYNTRDTRPRPGHVYLSTEPHAAHEATKNVTPFDTPILLKVNSQKLEHQNINPDEDLLDFEQQWRREIPPRGIDKGQYAEQSGWGNDPEDTLRGIRGTMSVAHRGFVPAEAITPHIQDKNMQWVPLPKADWGASSLEDLEHMYAKVADWTGPGDVSLTTQPAQHPMQKPLPDQKVMPSPFANVNQWQINIAQPSLHHQPMDDFLREFMINHHPDVPFQTQRGKGAWEGTPEDSTALHLYATPQSQMQEVVNNLGRTVPYEDYLAIVPHGHESYLWANPFAKSRAVASGRTGRLGLFGAKIPQERLGPEASLPFAPSAGVTASPRTEQDPRVAFGPIHNF